MSERAPTSVTLRAAAVCLLVLFLANCAFAQLGMFNRLGAWIFVAATLAFALSATADFGWSLAKAFCPRLRFGAVAVFGAMTLCFGLFLAAYYAPSDRIFGACDEGLYSNTAINLARTGHYYLEAPILSEMSDGEKAILLKTEPAAAQRGTKMRQVHPRYHVGLFLRSPNTTQLTPQFPLGWPTVLASFYTVGGWQALQAVNTGILFLCAIMAGILTLGWFGPVTASCAFVLFLFFPLDPWAARSLFSEPALGLTWLLTIFGWRESRIAPTSSGLLTGLAAGTMLYLKIEAALVVAGMLGLWAWHWTDRRRYVLVCAAAGLGSLTLAASAWRQFNQFYLADTFGSVPAKLLWGAAAVAVAIAGILARPAVQQFFRWRKKEPQGPPWFANRFHYLRLVRITAFWILIILAFYGATLRPEPATPDTYFYWPVQKEIRSFREETFQRLIWYWQPWGLAVATVGAAAMVFSVRKSWQVGFYGVGLFFLIGLSYDIRNNPIQPYAMRRFLPFAMPILIIGAALVGRCAANRRIPRPQRRRWMPAAAQVAITLVLLAGFIPINHTLNRHMEFAGTPKQIETMAGQLPPKALVLVSEGSVLSWVATPLQFIYDRECMIIPPTAFADPGFPALVERWTAQGRRPFLLTEKGGVRWFSRGTSQVLNPTGYETLSTSYLFQSPTERPERVVPLRLNYHLIPLEEW